MYPSDPPPPVLQAVPTTRQPWRLRVGCDYARLRRAGPGHHAPAEPAERQRAAAAAGRAHPKASPGARHPAQRRWVALTVALVLRLPAGVVTALGKVFVIT